jgi:DNA-directed RNA polymerase specialized sigma24 family protein
VKRARAESEDAAVIIDHRTIFRSRPRRHFSEWTMTGRSSDRDEASSTDETTDDTGSRPRAGWTVVQRAIADRLTPRQREVIELVYVRGMDQTMAAALLGITQQSVSEHLHGKLRRGVRVGGALRKLRRLCVDHAGDEPRT